MASDAQLELAINRLTENEKDRLRRRLLPQTAKEMAIELGISVHAIEKRLKMARTKLGLTSSLEAARQLAKSEQYGELVPQSSDLAGREPIHDETSAADTHSRRRHHLVNILGVLVVIFIFSGFLVLALQVPDNHADQSRASPAAGSTIAKPAMRTASPDEVRAFLASSFSTMDRDRSGYVERAEAPSAYGVGQSYSAGERPKNASVTWIRGTTAQAMWISKADSDADGKVSRAEYADWGFPLFAKRGVPANWKRKS